MPVNARTKLLIQFTSTKQLVSKKKELFEKYLITLPKPLDKISKLEDEIGRAEKEEDEIKIQLVNITKVKKMQLFTFIF